MSLRCFIFYVAINSSILLSCGTKGGGENKSEESIATAKVPVAEHVVRDTVPETTIKWIDSTFRDLGVVRDKDSALISFRFKNTGDKPLIVRSVKTTCGCTVADTLHKPVLPGKESRILLKFYSQGQAIAMHEKHVYVVTNTKPYQGTTLTFKVEVKE